MAVMVRIPQPLQKLTGGAAEVPAEGATAGDLIAHLNAQFDGFGPRILDDGGKLRRFVNVYLNDEDVRFLQGLDTPVKEGDKVSIVPAIAGGTEPGAAGNVKKKFWLTFPQKMIERPILWEMIKKFDIIPSLRSASVSHEIGLMGLELEGPPDKVAAAREWLESLEVVVEPLEKNVIE